MRWRFARLNWAYGLGELVIVVVGVLIALAVDQWNNQRIARLDEVTIIDRFIFDLRTDLEAIAFGLETISEKRASLLRLSENVETSPVRALDAVQFLTDVIQGAGYGWNQRRARRTTFDEVLASGRFGVIRDAETRVSISDYYAAMDNREQRIEERETPYPALTYQLVPRATEFELSTSLSDKQLSRIMDQVMTSELPKYAVAELNFSGFLREQFEEWRSRCLELLGTLEAYRTNIT